MKRPRNIQELSFEQILEGYGTKIATAEGNQYFELPFWFQKTEHGLILHTEPPSDLSTFISSAQLGGDNPQPDKKKL